MIMFTKKLIYGCDARGDADTIYLVRYILFRSEWLSIYFHIFYRSDADDMHDHPWPFVSLLLWRGYIECTTQGRSRKYPGMLLFRPATWIHRVELIDGKKAASLVVRGRIVRDWGFITKNGWVKWTSYFRKMGCVE